MQSSRSDDAYRDVLVHELSFARESLAKQGRTVQSVVDPLVKRLESDLEFVSVNELGELQSSGTMLDAKCARYMLAAQTLRNYDAFREASDAESR